VVNLRGAGGHSHAEYSQNQQKAHHQHDGRRIPIVFLISSHLDSPFRFSCSI
jgi:hypothetical protein